MLVFLRLRLSDDQIYSQSSKDGFGFFWVRSGTVSLVEPTGQQHLLAISGVAHLAQQMSVLASDLLEINGLCACWMNLVGAPT